MNACTYIISVKPVWADLFFSVEPKTVELRKGNFGKSLKAGDRLLIYATLPAGKIVGEVKVRDRSELPVVRLRGETEKFAGVSSEEFKAYYRDKDAGVAVWVDRPRKFESPIALAELKDAGIAPPQQLLKLTEKQVDALFRVGSELASNGEIKTQQPTLRQIFKHEWTDLEDTACRIEDLWKTVNNEGEEFYRHVDCRPKVLVGDILALAIPLAEKILSMETANDSIKNVARSLLETTKEPPFKYKADVIRHTALQLAEMVLSPNDKRTINPDMPF